MLAAVAVAQERVQQLVAAVLVAAVQVLSGQVSMEHLARQIQAAVAVVQEIYQAQAVAQAAQAAQALS
jgi:hypothetical protein